MHDAVLTLTLPDEERTDTVSSFDDEALFRYIPAKMKNRTIQIRLEAPDYLPLDTEVVLTPSLQLPLRRDPQVYGALSATVVMDGHPVPNLPIKVESFDVTTDENGRFSLFVPLPKQQKAYSVTVPTDYSILSTLYAPCGKNAIVIL